MEYQVISTLKRDGKKFYRGEKVKLSAADAEELKLLGVVKDIKLVAPSGLTEEERKAAILAKIPTDPAVRLTAIKAAIATLDAANASLFTKGGKPTTEALSAALGEGWVVTAAERDQAVAQ